MFRLPGSAATARLPIEEERYTRFDREHQSPGMDAADQQLTRFARREAGAHETVTRTVESSAPPNTPTRDIASQHPRQPHPAPIADSAHLHAEDQIPVWVLRKALPQRFSG